jgi:hypothetical protein
MISEPQDKVVKCQFSSRLQPPFESLNPAQSQQDSLDGKSARHKTLPTQQTHTDNHALNGIRTRGTSV